MYELGDSIAAALSLVGVTPQFVERWIGECCCKKRQERLNILGNWAVRVISGKVDKAAEYLEKIVS